MYRAYAQLKTTDKNKQGGKLMLFNGKKKEEHIYFDGYLKKLCRRFYTIFDNFVNLGLLPRIDAQHYISSFYSG